jgi:hypothetical protein
MRAARLLFDNLSAVFSRNSRLRRTAAVARYVGIRYNLFGAVDERERRNCGAITLQLGGGTVERTRAGAGKRGS